MKLVKSVSGKHFCKVLQNHGWELNESAEVIISFLKPAILRYSLCQSTVTNLSRPERYVACCVIPVCRKMIFELVAARRLLAAFLPALAFAGP